MFILQLRKMNFKYILLCLAVLVLFASCENERHKGHKIGNLEVSTPIKKDTLIYNNYVAQIHAHQHIELRSLERGYLQQILIDEGASVKKSQLLFKIQPL